MFLNAQQTDTLEKSGGLILDQLVSVNAITPQQQGDILAQQTAIERQTGNKPFVGELLEKSGFDTRNVKQELLDLQATSRAVLASRGETNALARAEGPQGTVYLQDGVSDNKWTKADLESPDPAKQRTAKLQTQLQQTKVLVAVADKLEASGTRLPETMVTAILASQDTARTAFAGAIRAAETKGLRTKALEDAYQALPPPTEAKFPSQLNTEVAEGITVGVRSLESKGVLTKEQADTLVSQTHSRASDLNTLNAKEATRDRVAGKIAPAAAPAAPASRTDAVGQQRQHSKPGNGQSR